SCRVDRSCMRHNLACGALLKCFYCLSIRLINGAPTRPLQIEFQLAAVTLYLCRTAGGCPYVIEEGAD
ncbi:MAG: hypothetical protein WB853_03440, partial [Desulfobacterales bacterium]